MKQKHLVPWAVGLLVAGAASRAEAGLEDLIAESIFSELDDPVWVTSAPDGALSITLLPGVVLRQQEVVLDIQDQVHSGGGLHSVAFHPTQPWLFVHFSEAESADFVVSRFALAGDPPRAQVATEVELLRSPKAFPLHYGGQLAFGPDGYLWISTGDGSIPGSPDPECAAQDTEKLDGKILRLDVDSRSNIPPYYTFPADNPFASSGGAEEVWGYGLRNPWRFSFDRETGDLWLSDVGELLFEEVNVLSAGAGAGTNFGWKAMEGNHCFGDLSGCGASLPGCGDAGYRLPRIEYDHTAGRCSVIGGFVYRGRLIPELYGRYVYGDFCSGEVWARGASGAVETLPIVLPGLKSFGEDAAGELWMAAGDQVYRLRDPSLPAAGLVELEAPSLTVSEGDGMVEIGILRVGGSTGPMRVLLSPAGLSATGGVDFVATATEFAWGDGEADRKIFQIALIDDNASEGVESLEVTLDLISGDGLVGARDRATVSLEDNDGCAQAATHLCLNNGRFRASVSWQTAEGLEGAGQAVTLGEDSGSFWFFSANNPEIFIKVLDACQLHGFNSFWVFAAGLTDVQTTLRVVDTATGEERVYQRALGESYDPVRDTAAFSTCP